MSESIKPAEAFQAPVGAGGFGAMVPLTGWKSILSSLRLGNFRWFWLGSLAGFFGMQMQVLARGWLAYEMTHRPLDLGLVSAAWGFPMVAFSLLGGVMTDRLYKRNLLMLTQGVMALLAVGLALLTLLDIIQFWHLLVFSFIQGVVFAFNMPGRQAIVPELVGEGNLMNAIGLSSAGMNLSRVAAPALAGGLVALIGVGGVFVVVSFFYLLAIVSLGLIRTDWTPKRISTSIGHDMVEGLKSVRYSPNVMGLIGLAFIPVILGLPYMALLPVFAKDVLKVGPAGLGALMALSGVGALAGSILVAALTEFRYKGLLMMILLIGFGLSITFFSSSSYFLLSLLAMVLVGVTSAGYSALNSVLLQTAVTHEIRGRIMSLYSMTFGLMPLGTLPIAAISQAAGVQVTLGACGALLAFFTLVTLFLRPNLRRLT